MVTLRSGPAGNGAKASRRVEAIRAAGRPLSRHVERRADAVATSWVDGAHVAEWSFYVTETSRLSLPTRDGETGNSYLPLTLVESYAVRYLVGTTDR